MLNGYVHQFKHLFARNLFEIYFLLAFRALGFSFIGIFIPLYLSIELGFPFSSVIYYFMAMALAFALGSYFSLPLITKYGAKHAMIWSYPLLILGFLVVISLAHFPSLYLLAAILKGFSMGIFWMGFHIDVGVYSHKKTIGKESGTIHFSSILGAIVGPLIGGLVLYYYTFTVLFSLAILAFIISLVPMLFSKELYVKTAFDFRSLFVREHIKYFFGYFAQGVRVTVLTVAWPLFIFAIFGSYVVLGGYAAFATFSIGILGYFAGVSIDTVKQKGILMRIAVPFEATLWVFRAFVTTTTGVFLVALFGGITSLGIDLPLLAKTYSRAKKEQIAAFVFFRESSIRVGEFVALLFLLLVVDLKASFFFAAASSLLYLLF